MVIVALVQQTGLVDQMMQDYKGQCEKHILVRIGNISFPRFLREGSVKLPSVQKACQTEAGCKVFFFFFLSNFPLTLSEHFYLKGRG